MRGWRVHICRLLGATDRLRPRFVRVAGLDDLGLLCVIVHHARDGGLVQRGLGLGSSMVVMHRFHSLADLLVVTLGSSGVAVGMRGKGKRGRDRIPVPLVDLVRAVVEDVLFLALAGDARGIPLVLGRL